MSDPKNTPLAIVGIGCHFPKAAGPTAYWSNVREGVDAITEVPPTHWSPADYFDADPKSPDRTYGRRGGFLSPVEFDPTEFGITPNNIPATDPAQLLGLVAAADALRDAGYGPERAFDRKKVSVILGVTGTLELVVPLGARLGHPIWRRALRQAGVDEATVERVVRTIADSYVAWQENSFPGLLGNVVAGRIANRLDLGGTNCVVDAACASSMSAGHLASMELQSGRADMVVTGGVDCFNDIFMYMCFSKTPALSPTGDSRPFDSQGDGTILGEGIGMLVLKRLADAERDGDKVYAVLKGIGSSSDGRGKAIYAPSPEGQVQALENAYRLSGVSPETIELVEAHGTGTKAGDAAEAKALTEVYRRAKAQGTWCALGSVKSQIGHTKAAAGSAGLIKAALSLYHKVLPPTAKVRKPLPELEPDSTPFYVNTVKRPWLSDPGHPRRAAVSAFGFGGSNFHAVLEEHRPAKAGDDWDGAVQLLAFSSDTLEGLRSAVDAFPPALEWDALRVKAMETRRAFRPAQAFRFAMVVEKGADLEKVLEEARRKLEDDAKPFSTPSGAHFGSGKPGKLAALFAGQGSQYVGMSRDLACGFAAMHETLEEAEKAIPGLFERIYPRPVFDAAASAKQEAELRATQAAQPALGAIGLGQLRVLKRFGVEPELFGGHSYGELVALCAAGAYGAEAMFRLSRLRGELMARSPGDLGSMLAVLASAETVSAALAESGLDLTLANKNAPAQTVVSGATAEIERAAEALAGKGLKVARLPVAAAFHSPLVAGAKGPLRDALELEGLKSPSKAVYANKTAEAYPGSDAECRELLADQLASPVEFVRQIENMHRDGARVFLELGPGARMTGLVRSILGGRDHHAVALDASAGKKHGGADLARALVQLAAAGVAVDLTPWQGGEAGVRDVLGRRKPKVSVTLTGATPRPPRKEPPPTPPAAVPEPRPRIELRPEPRPAASQAAPQDSVLSEALRTSQEGIVALQKLQEQAAALHRQFLEGQQAAHRTLHQLLDRQQRVYEAALGLAPSAPAALAETVSPPALVQAPPAPAPIPAEKAPEKVPAGTFSGESTPEVESTLLSVVSEKTGYPAETLNLDMGMESDLGIDSIKRVEILSAMREKLPNAPAIGSEHIGTLRTLRDVVGFLSAGRTAPAEKAPEKVPAGTFSGGSAPEVESTLLSVVSEKTGYPAETLNLDMGMESDLGIDSIKRVEILSSLRERMPSLPAIGSDQIGVLRTLRSVVEFLTGGRAAASGPASSGGVVHGGRAPERPTVMERTVVAAVRLEPAKAASAPNGASVWVAGEGSDLSRELAAALVSAGWRAELRALPLTDRPETLDGLVVVAPEASPDPGRFVKDAFVALQACGPALRRSGGLLACVTRLDGRFGLAGASFEPVLGGLAGLAKTAAKEWPEVRCRALDVASGWPQAAPTVVGELLAEGPLETALGPDGRWGLTLEPAPLADAAPELGPEDVVVVTGGARGVTAEAAVALAEASRPALLLLGRTPAPEPEPDWLKGLSTEREMKAAILANAGAPLAPKALEERYRRLAAHREAARTLARIEAAGSKVRYVSLDIRDESAVRAALDEARRSMGPIRAIVHGAGVLADRRIEDKTPEQFDAVFDTKVAGLQALLAATRGDDLRAIALFSSVTGRFGRVGQADYAAANEALNKAAQLEARRRTACRVVAINWGPWDGGMVTPSLRRFFEEEGAGLIGLRDGANHLVRELATPAGGLAECVVLARHADDAAPVPASRVDDGMSPAFERSIELASHPFLESHVLNGRPVVPLAVIAEWLAHGALHSNPGLQFAGLDDLRVTKGLAIDGGRAVRVRVSCAPAAAADGVFRVPVELRAVDTGALHAQATAVLATAAPAAPPAGPEPRLEPYGKDVASAYGGALFHGPRMRMLRSVEGCSDEGAAALAARAPRPSEWMAEPLRSDWILEPGALDAAFQLMIIWSTERKGAGSLPSFVRSYRQFARAFPASTRIVATVRSASGSTVRADIDFLGADGRLLARLEGFEGTMDASLQASFRRNVLSPA